MQARVAQRYAQALMDIGTDANMLDRIAKDMLLIEETINGSHELRSVIASHAVRPYQKRKVLEAIFSKHIAKEVSAFIELLVSKGRGEMLIGAAEEFRRLLDLKMNIVVATVTSAVALSENEQSIIHQKLEQITGKKVRTIFSIDPKLRGGFIARIGDTLIDASLKHQLDLLRQQFKTGGAVLN
jgi:F-type H+-transporting ATPase subunit delta